MARDNELDARSRQRCRVRKRNSAAEPDWPSAAGGTAGAQLISRTSSAYVAKQAIATRCSQTSRDMYVSVWYGMVWALGGAEREMYARISRAPFFVRVAALPMLARPP